MATKKPASKKTTTAKKPAAKQTTKPKKPAIQSFRRSVETTPFMTVKITQQTFYWLIIAVISVVFTLWVFQLQKDVNDLYDQVEMIRASEPTVPIVKKQVD